VKPKLKKIARPEGQADHYQFFLNEETGRKWKVKMEMLDGQTAQKVVGGELAPTAFAVTVAASQVDEAGKALRDRGGRPIVTDVHMHLFTPHEMSLPNFDPQAKIAEKIEERIKMGEHRMNGEKKLLDFAANWRAS
jgi:hypothetical protein